jgi:hypothetical protein
MRGKWDENGNYGEKLEEGLKRGENGRVESQIYKSFREN